MDRQVVRIVTPGSLVEDSMLTPDENNYLAALYVSPSGSMTTSTTTSTTSTWALAWADLSTGEFSTTTTSSDKIASAVLRCAPKEILLPDGLATAAAQDDTWDQVLQAIPASCMRTFRPVASFQNTHRVGRAAATGSGAGGPSPPPLLDAAEQAAAAAILDYIDFTQKDDAKSRFVRAPQHVEANDHMIIDSSAWKSLELAKVGRWWWWWAFLSVFILTYCFVCFFLALDASR